MKRVTPTSTPSYLTAHPIGIVLHLYIGRMQAVELILSLSATRP